MQNQREAGPWMACAGALFLGFIGMACGILLQRPAPQAAVAAASAPAVTAQATPARQKAQQGPLHTDAKSSTPRVVADAVTASPPRR